MVFLAPFRGLTRIRPWECLGVKVGRMIITFMNRYLMIWIEMATFGTMNSTFGINIVWGETTKKQRNL